MGEPVCGQRRLCAGDVADCAHRGEENLEEQRRHAHACDRVAERPSNNRCVSRRRRKPCVNRCARANVLTFNRAAQTLRCWRCHRRLDLSSSRSSKTAQGALLGSLRRRRQPLPRPPLPRRPQAKTRLLLREAGDCVTSEDSSHLCGAAARGARHPAQRRPSTLRLRSSLQRRSRSERPRSYSRSRSRTRP